MRGKKKKGRNKEGKIEVEGEKGTKRWKRWRAERDGGKWGRIED